MTLGTGDQALSDSTKKEALAGASYDAGQVLPDGTVLKSPFVSSVITPQQKQSAAVRTVTKSTLDATMPGAGFWMPGYTDLVSLIAGYFGGNLQQAPAGAAATTPARTGGADYSGVKDFAGAAASAGVQQSKKEAYVSGFSDQYIVDGGLLYWNPYNGYGTSTDPATGQTVAYQRDVYIGGQNGPIYAPDGSVGTKKDALVAASWDNNQTFTYSRALDANEYAKARAQADPNYVVGSWNSGGKKTISEPGAGSSPGHSYSAQTAASAPAGIDMSSAPLSGGSWDDYW
jgi:hypothetical protein